MKELYFIRHGQTDYNAKKIIQGSGVDSSLNTKGKRQAQQFFDYYHNVPFQLIITSALKRTKQTVLPFNPLNIPQESTPLINEMHWGIHEGKKGTAKMRDSYLNMIASWKAGDLDVSMEGGESARDLLKRLDKFLEDLKSKSENQILICTHGRALRALNVLMRKESAGEMEKYKFHNTCLYKYQLIDQEFIPILENDTSHLNG